MYKIIDRQGGGLKRTERHATLDQVRESLASFHGIDVDHADDMHVKDLCEIGDWDVETDDGTSIFTN